MTRRLRTDLRYKTRAILNVRVEKIMQELKKLQSDLLAHNRLKIQRVIQRITWRFLEKMFERFRTQPAAHSTITKLSPTLAK
jgi:hypothetical protein